jgi:hypothetical protein
MKYFLGEQGDEENVEEDDEEWQEVGPVSGDQGNVKSKKGKTPLENVMSIIGAEHFKGVRVVD